MTERKTDNETQIRLDNFEDSFLVQSYHKPVKPPQLKKKL